MPMLSPPIARTPLHAWHAAHGARFTGVDGWQFVGGYGSVEQEVAAARASLGLADISAGAKIGLRGRGIPELARSLVPNSAALEPRGVASVPSHPGLACRLSEQHLLLLESWPTARQMEQRLTDLLQGQLVIRTDVTSAYAGFWVLGPRLEEVLRRLTNLDVRLAAFPVNACAETSLAGVEALLVRSAELAVLSMRVYVAWDMAEYVWERLIGAAGREGISPVGQEAVRQLG